MQPPRVLYVDDDEDSREMLRMLLELRSIETKAVGTAREALSSIQAEHFDLYLLDGWLPDLDGFELCRQMRCYDSHTPILFFSGVGREADKKMAIRLEPMLTLSSPTLVTCSEVLLADEGQNLRVFPQ
jgi:DNA-binding response OmpR family regulator